MQNDENSCIEPRRRMGTWASILARTAGSVAPLALKKAGLRLPKTLTPVAWATLVGGVLFVGLERWLYGRRTTDRITWAIALAVAVGQLIAAAYPGASRSGTTILIALALGLSRNAAAEFSFLLGIPTLMAVNADTAYRSVAERRWIDVPDLAI